MEEYTYEIKLNGRKVANSQKEVREWIESEILETGLEELTDSYISITIKNIRKHWEDLFSNAHWNLFSLFLKLDFDDQQEAIDLKKLIDEVKSRMKAAYKKNQEQLKEKARKPDIHFTN